MTTRQEAITNALQWLEEAELMHGAAEARRHFKHADRARRMANTWTALAQLLPDPEPQPEPDMPTPVDATERSALNEPPSTRCRNRHTTPDGDVRCDRQHGHHGMHSRPGYNWPNLSAEQRRPADCCLTPCQHPHCGDTCPHRKRRTEPVVAPVPGQRPTVEDGPAPRCLSRYQAADGVERCDREAGHRGVHQGVTVAWRSEQAIVGPDYSAATESRCPSQYATAASGLRCIRPAGHVGVHCDAGVRWRDHEALPDERAEQSHAGLCCQQAVALVAEQLEQHARTAAGLTEYERRVIEDAADFVRAHQPAAAYPEREAPCDRWINGEPHPAHTFVARNDGPARCPGTAGRHS